MPFSAAASAASLASTLMAGSPTYTQPSPVPAAGPYSGSAGAPKQASSHIDLAKDAISAVSHASGLSGTMRGRNAKNYLDQAHPGTSPGERIGSGQRDPGSTADPELASVQRAHEARLAGMQAHSEILSSLSGRAKDRYAKRALDMYMPMIDMTPEEAISPTEHESALEVQSRGQAHDVGMQSRGQAHDVGMQSRGQAHDVGMQSRGQAHDVGMQSREMSTRRSEGERSRIKDLTIAQGQQDLGHRDAASSERSSQAAALRYLGRTGRAAQQIMYDAWAGVTDMYDAVSSYTEPVEAVDQKAERQALQPAFGPAEMVGAGAGAGRMLGRMLRGGPPPVPRSRPRQRPPQARDARMPDYPDKGPVRDYKTGRWQKNPNVGRR